MTSDGTRLSEADSRAGLAWLWKVVAKLSGPKVAAVFRDRPDKRLFIIRSLSRELQLELGPRGARAVLQLGEALNGLPIGPAAEGGFDEAAEIERELRAKLAAHSWPEVYRLAARAIVAWHLRLRTHPLTVTPANVHPWEEEASRLLASVQDAQIPSKKIKAKLRKLARVYLAGSVGATFQRHVQTDPFGWSGWWPPLQKMVFTFEDEDVADAHTLVLAAGSTSPDREIARLKNETAAIVWEYRYRLWGLAGPLRSRSTLSARRVRALIEPPDEEDDPFFDFQERTDDWRKAQRKEERELFSRYRRLLASHRVEGLEDLRHVYSKRMFTHTRFKRALDYLACHAPPRSSLVHADIGAQHHAWVEMLLPRKLVYDPVLQELYEIAGYYEEMQPEVLGTYTRDRALEQLLQTGHYGPWDEDLWRWDDESEITDSELRRYRKILSEGD